MAGRSRVNRGVTALNKVVSGETLSQPERNALSWLQEVTGAKRPLAEYAPRTRRRYVARARSTSSTGRAGGASEYQKRKASVAAKTGGLTPKQYTVINKLIKRRNGYMKDSVVDWDILSNYVEAFGYKHVRDIMVDELDSIEEYVENNNRFPGNRRWFGREHEIYKPNFNDRLANTDILYYYHGTRG